MMRRSGMISALAATETVATAPVGRLDSRRDLMGRLRKLSAIILAGAALAAGAGNRPAASADAANFPARIALPDGWRPEGITAGHGTTLYVGSLA